MNDIVAPNTAHYVEELKANLKQVGNESASLSLRTAQLRTRPYVEDATRKVIGETVRSIEDAHRIKKAPHDQIEWALHYTSTEAILAMLEKDRYIRMSSSLGFNDPDEGQYLWRSTLGMRKAREAGFLPQQNESEETPSYAYIASFILNQEQDPDRNDAADNNIPYWMHYGDDGNGVAIKVAIPLELLYKVKYGHHEAWKTVAIIQEQIDPLLETVEEIGNYYVSAIAKSIIQQSLQRVNFLYKSRYYAYEQECRAIELADRTDLPRQVTYKENRGSKTFRSHLNHPYLSTKGENGPFRSGSELIIGPCVENRQDAVDYFELLIKRNDLRTQVKTSQINYRRSGNR